MVFRASKKGLTNRTIAAETTPETTKLYRNGSECVLLQKVPQHCTFPLFYNWFTLNALSKSLRFNFSVYVCWSRQWSWSWLHGEIDRCCRYKRRLIWWLMFWYDYRLRSCTITSGLRCIYILSYYYITLKVNFKIHIVYVSMKSVTFDWSAICQLARIAPRSSITDVIYLYGVATFWIYSIRILH